MNKPTNAGKHVLLTNALAAPFLRDYLRAAGADVDVALDMKTLERLVETHAPNLRLVAFLTDIIVPERLLNRLALEPYNIHPGPPTFPGVNPEVFAIWEGADTFGVTAHVIAPQVDSGAIVYTQAMPIIPGVARQTLADQTFPLAIDAFRCVADYCVATDSPMPRTGAVWKGSLRTRAMFKRLCIEPSLNPALENIRIRACGEDIRGDAHKSPMTT